MVAVGRGVGEGDRDIHGAGESMNIYEVLERDHRRSLDLGARILETRNDDVQAREDLFADLRRQKQVHAEAERKLFYPHLDTNNDWKEIVTRRLDEHRDFNRRLDALGNMLKKGPEWRHSFEKLYLEIEAHIRFEERELFPKLHGMLAREDAESLGERAARGEAQRLNP